MEGLMGKRGRPTSDFECTKSQHQEHVRALNICCTPFARCICFAKIRRWHHHHLSYAWKEQSTYKRKYFYAFGVCRSHSIFYTAVVGSLATCSCFWPKMQLSVLIMSGCDRFGRITGPWAHKASYCMLLIEHKFICSPKGRTVFCEAVVRMFSPPIQLTK